ncbi:MAG TPA: TauD/TfdA family dioxygenase [Lacipirellulaceae bacterium]|nr:TauD/TfdA family dioxygenase [Lacipirellulaceae bacterium]
MPTITVKPIRDDLPFGGRVSGVTLDSLNDEGNRALIKRSFEERGVLIFEDVDQNAAMQVAISKVLGPLKDHPVATVDRTDEDMAPGVIVIRSDGDGATVEVDGRQLDTSKNSGL